MREWYIVNNGWTLSDYLIMCCFSPVGVVGTHRLYQPPFFPIYLW